MLKLFLMVKVLVYVLFEDELSYNDKVHPKQPTILLILWIFELNGKEQIEPIILWSKLASE